jgi:hypothetical protein
MSGITQMLIVWSVITAVLLCLVIYRTILGNAEEDQLFLDKAEAALEREQQDVIKRINRIDPFIKWGMIASIALLLIIGGIWLYQGLFAPPTMG